MFKSILLTIDLEHAKSWEKALPQAIDLAKASGGTLHILGIVHDVGSAMVSSYLPADFEVQALQNMKAALDKFVDEHVPSDVGVEIHVGHGHVAEMILKNAKKWDADLIVMASHPPDELRSLLVGSYANKVVRNAKSAVLVVR